MNKTVSEHPSFRAFAVRYAFMFSAVLVILVFTAINPKILSLYSLQNITLEMAPLLVMALGIGFVLYTGCIDLSIGAIASASCVITGMFVGQAGNGMILYMLLLGAFAGLLNGILVARLKLPSFIVTLCTQSVWRAVAIILSGGGSNTIPLKQRHIVNWASANVLWFPVVFWISLAFLLAAVIIERKTELGKSMFVVGANERAARLTGVHTENIKLYTYMLCGVCAALGGVMYAYKLKSSVPTIGDNLFMLAISSVALGGTLFSGGRGSALRTLIGVITVIFISSGMNMARVDPMWKNVVFGCILILAVAINTEKGVRDLVIK